MSAPARPRVALIHATSTSMRPAWAAFAAEFGEAELWNLLDDRLVVEADNAGGLTPPLRARMRTLLEYARDGGADAIQLTCSMYAPVTEDVRADWPIPVRASDEAMYEAVARAGFGSVALLGSLESAVGDSARRLAQAVTARGTTAPRVAPYVSPAAGEAARHGDDDALRECVREAVRDAATEVDAVLVAQYSVAGGVTPDLEAGLGVPLLSPPHLAARALRAALLRMRG